MTPPPVPKESPLEMRAKWRRRRGLDDVQDDLRRASTSQLIRELVRRLGMRP